ncbi:MAG: nucleotide exchange factor GrpE [Pseudomonadales bacterium]
MAEQNDTQNDQGNAAEQGADDSVKNEQTEQDLEADGFGQEKVEGKAEDGAEQTDDAELDPIEKLEAEVERLNQQLGEAKDQALRAAAEAQNVRRRAEKDVESAHKFGLEKFCRELLEVVDNLERAQNQADSDSGSGNDALKPLLEGVELTHKSFIDVLAKFKLEPINPIGEPFDPQLHQAITMLENPDSEPNTVLDVMQNGYNLHGRLLRPAMVVVSK